MKDLVFGSYLAADGETWVEVDEKDNLELRFDGLQLTVIARNRGEECHRTLTPSELRRLREFLRDLDVGGIEQIEVRPGWIIPPEAEIVRLEGKQSAVGGELDFVWTGTARTYEEAILKADAYERAHHPRTYELITRVTSIYIRPRP